MEWHFGADEPVQLGIILNQIYNADYNDIPDGSIFVPTNDYEAKNIRLDTPAHVSETPRKDAGDWTYYLELALIKELCEGWDGVDQELLDGVTNYSVYDTLPDE